MIPMNEFQNIRKDLHGKFLLLRAASEKMAYMFGYYDAVDDIFYVIRRPYMAPENTDDQDYRKISVITGERETIYCLCPKMFEKPMGMRAFDSFMRLGDALDSMEKMNAFRTDIENILKEPEHLCPYLVITNDNKICISSIGSFNISGNQFVMCIPNTEKTEDMQCDRVLSRDRIRAVVNLADWEKHSQNRLADIDELYKDIAAMDLSYMQQGDVMECIKDCMERHVRKAGMTK